MDKSDNTYTREQCSALHKICLSLLSSFLFFPSFLCRTLSVTLHVLLNLIASDELGVEMSLVQEYDPEKRSALMLQQADKMGCRKFVRPKNVVEGNARLNLAFVANLFNTFPALKPPEEREPDLTSGQHYMLESMYEMVFRKLDRIDY